MLWNHYSVIPLAVLEIEENEPAKMLHLCFRSTGVEEDREPSAAPFGHSQPVPLLLCYPACSKRQGDYLLLWSCQKAFIADNSTSFHLEQARKEVVWGLQQNGVPLWDSTLYDLPRRSRLAPVHLLKPRHIAELTDFSFGSNPLKWSPLKSQILSSHPSGRQRQCRFSHGMRTAVNKFTRICSSWLFCGSTAICLPTE